MEPFVRPYTIGRIDANDKARYCLRHSRYNVRHDHSAPTHYWACRYASHHWQSGAPSFVCGGAPVSPTLQTTWANAIGCTVRVMPSRESLDACSERRSRTSPSDPAAPSGRIRM